jgi:biotin carboxylase
MTKKIAVIGASVGQLPICLKAKEIGIDTICFAWPDGAVCKDIVDKFFPISILEKDSIVEICRREKIDGVVSNGSDLTAEIVSYVATQLNLHGILYDDFLKLRDKQAVRRITNEIDGLESVGTSLYNGKEPINYPCIVKPVTGASKCGVNYVDNKDSFNKAIINARSASQNKIMIENYIDGDEISIETISFEGHHFVIQITDKENSGPPHFVELSHHQPSMLSTLVKNKIGKVIPQLLDAVKFYNGASHIEMKVDGANNLFLIEINPRGGGDEISNKLVQLSTGFDYVKAMIEVALGSFDMPVISNKKYSGIYYLCGQRASRLPFFEKLNNQSWLVEKKFDVSKGLTNATGNYDRNGYFIYQSESKILI